MTPEEYKFLDGKLHCLECKGDLIQFPEMMRCCSCSQEYPFSNGQIFFIGKQRHDDATDDLKSAMKNFLGPAYHKIFKPLFSPSIPLRLCALTRRYTMGEKKINVEIGSGNQKISPKVYAIDFFNYPNVDIVCDASSLPFKDGTVDTLISNTMLEHVEHFDLVLCEMKRVTKEMGVNIHVVPFLYPFHASPGDFRRYTHIGFVRLFEGWNVVDQRPVTGPFTLFNAVVSEFISSLASFGNSKLRAYLYLFVCAFFAPLKFLDYLIIWNRKTITVAPTILTVLQKQKLSV